MKKGEKKMSKGFFLSFSFPNHF